MKKYTEVRFVKVPVILYDIKQAEIIGYNKDSAEDTGYMMIDPFDISYYRASQSDDKGDEWDNTLIWFKNGESWHANLEISQFENLLNNHYDPK